MKVTFTPISKESELLIPSPKVASEYLPEWYRNMPSHEPGYNGNKTSRHGVGSARTLKGCSPFLDTLISGYVFELAADVEFMFRSSDGVFVPQWIADYPLIQSQATFEVPGIPLPYANTEPAFKWAAGWKMNTPKGYSTLFTHPLNRHDLPFRTMSGIVETDTYNIETNFPFQILDPGTKETLVIKKGTPIVQAIPFKRDDWESTVLPANEDEYKKNLFDLKATVDRSYRNKFWIRKIFK